MARKKIREYDAKRLLCHHLKRHLMAMQATSSTRLADAAREHDWLTRCRLVVKPDMLFGKRGKHNLVALNVDVDGAQRFLTQLLHERGEVEVGGVRGTVTTCLVEPFIPHQVEYYFSIRSVREGNEVRFSCHGGMDVEERWEDGRRQLVRPGERYTAAEALALVRDERDAGRREKLASFVAECFAVYDDLDFTLMEMNPLTVAVPPMSLAMEGAATADGLAETVLPLDMRGELDSYAAFQNARKWLHVEFPEAWGRQKWPQERAVAELDEKSSASLKLTILNPRGRIWTMVAGGGASVIYSDTVVDLGYGDELGNYAEYSGNPKPEETYLFARALLELVTHEPDGRPRCLLVGGGIANFTDVAATFSGILQAMKDFAGKLQMAKVKVFVRRGGPNYKTGLRLMEELGAELGIPMEVYGPQVNMTAIVTMGIEWIAHGPPPGSPAVVSPHHRRSAGIENGV